MHGLFCEMPLRFTHRKVSRHVKDFALPLSARIGWLRVYVVEQRGCRRPNRLREEEVLGNPFVLDFHARNPGLFVDEHGVALEMPVIPPLADDLRAEIDEEKEEGNAADVTALLRVEWEAYASRRIISFPSVPCTRFAVCLLSLLSVRAHRQWFWHIVVSGRWWAYEYGEEYDVDERLYFERLRKDNFDLLFREELGGDASRRGTYEAEREELLRPHTIDIERPGPPSFPGWGCWFARARALRSRLSTCTHTYTHTHTSRLLRPHTHTHSRP